MDTKGFWLQFYFKIKEGKNRIIKLLLPVSLGESDQPVHETIQMLHHEQDQEHPMTKNTPPININQHKLKRNLCSTLIDAKIQFLIII